MKILMVCLGNICRSPLAEGIMKAKITAQNLDWQVDSAGTGNWHVGELPDRRSIAIARKYGIDITDQRARQFTSEDFHTFDWILTMDHSNYRDVMRLAQNFNHQNAKVGLILNEAFPGNEAEVPDPYWDDNGFETVFKMLDDACEQLVNQWSEGH